MLVFNAPYPTSGASVPTFRYFILNITATNGFGFADLIEMQMASSAAGTNLVQGKTVSSVPSGSGGQPISAIVDGTTSGAWESTSLPVAIKLDMGAGNAFTPAELRLAPNSVGQPKDFTLSGSNDDISYTQILSVVGFTSYAGVGLFSTFSISSAAPTFSVSPTVATNTSFFGTGDVATVSYTHNGTSTAIRWLRDGVAISGATSASYTYVSGDVGHTVVAEITASTWAASTTATSSGNSIVTPAFATDTRVPAGDMQSGSDGRLTAGDMQSGTDLRITTTRTA